MASYTLTPRYYSKNTNIRYPYSLNEYSSTQEYRGFTTFFYDISFLQVSKINTRFNIDVDNNTPSSDSFSIECRLIKFKAQGTQARYVSNLYEFNDYTGTVNAYTRKTVPVPFNTDEISFSIEDGQYLCIQITGYDGSNFYTAYKAPTVTITAESTSPMSMDFPRTIILSESYQCSINNREGHLIDIGLSYNGSSIYSETIHEDEFTFYSSAIVDEVNSSQISATFTAVDTNIVSYTRRITGTVTIKYPDLDFTLNSPSESGNYGSVAVNPSFDHTMRFVCKVGSSEKYNSTFKDTERKSFKCDDNWFVGTSSNTLNVSITVSDTTISSRKPVTKSFTLNASDSVKPSLSEVSVEKDDADVIPESIEYYASGFSKAKVSAKVVPGVNEIIKVSFNYNNQTNVEMSLNSETGMYEATTPTAIVRDSEGKVKFTVSVVDATNRKDTEDVYAENVQNLPEFTATASPSRLEVGNQATISFDGNITEDVFYSVTKGDTVLVPASSEHYSSSFTIYCDPNWFVQLEETQDSISVEFNIFENGLTNRKKTIHVTISLPSLNITATPKVYLEKDTTVSPAEIYGTVEVTISGTAGRSASVKFKSNEVTLREVTNSGDGTISVNCPKSWFTTAGETGYELKVNTSVEVGNKEKETSFKLCFPDLTIAVDSMSVFVADDLSCSFNERMDESVQVRFKSGKNMIGQSYGPYTSDSATIQVPQLFDLIGDTKNKTISVSIVVFDGRGRSTELSKLEVNANDDMRPVIDSVVCTPINPSTVDASFANNFISNISKFQVVTTVSTPTNSPIKTAFVEINGSSYKLGRTDTPNVLEFAFQSDFTIEAEKIPSPSIVGGVWSFSIVVEDERGMRNVPSTNFQSAIVYVLPVISNVHYHRCRQDKTPDDSGEYCLATFDYEIDPIETNTFPPAARNAGEITIFSTDTKVAANDYSSVVVVEETSGVDPFELYTGSLEFLFFVDRDYSYDIELKVEDYITSYTYSYKLSTGMTIMDIKQGGKGLAFGKVAEHDNVVEIAPQWTLKANTINLNGADLGTLLADIERRLQNGGL